MTRTVVLPVRSNWHEAIKLLDLEPWNDRRIIKTVTLEVPWACPKCGGPRGEPVMGMNGDDVHGWESPCGHPDTYTRAIEDAVAYKKLSAGPQRPRQLTLF